MVFKGSPGALWGMLFSKNIRNGWEFSPTLKVRNGSRVFDFGMMFGATKLVSNLHFQNCMR
jgi:hypothetical protein